MKVLVVCLMASAMVMVVVMVVSIPMQRIVGDKDTSMLKKMAFPPMYGKLTEKELGTALLVTLYSFIDIFVDFYYHYNYFFLANSFDCKVTLILKTLSQIYWTLYLETVCLFACHSVVLVVGNCGLYTYE